MPVSKRRQAMRAVGVMGGPDFVWEFRPWFLSHRPLRKLMRKQATVPLGFLRCATRRPSTCSLKWTLRRAASTDRIQLVAGFGLAACDLGTANGFDLRP